MIQVTPISVVIDMLEILQTELEILSVDEIYEILEQAIYVLVKEEEE